MNTYLGFRKTIACVVTLILISPLSHGTSYKLPKFQLGKGDSLTQVDIISDKQLATDKNSDAFAYYDRERARTHILKREEDLNGRSSYKFMQLIDRKYEGMARSSVKYEPGEYEKLFVKITGDGTNRIISPEEDESEQISDGEKLHVIGSIAPWELLTEIANNQSYDEGVSTSISKLFLKRFGFIEGKVTLSSVEKMWQMTVAEFSFSGKVNSGECHGSAWFSYKDGRPIQQYWSCNKKASDLKRNAITNSLVIRGWQYSDKLISQMSPTPLPQLHPNGAISDLAYSASLERLMILSQSNQSNEQWLTYWDSRRRQPILSKKVVGNKLSISEDEKTVAIASSQGFINGEVQFGGKFKSFGQIIPKEINLEKKLLAMGMYGAYPVTLNSEGSINVWNLGYKKLIDTYQPKNKNQIYLDARNDGNVVTSSKGGEAYLYEMNIDSSQCGAKSNDSWCEEARLDKFELIKFISIPSRDIDSINLHPSKPVLGLLVNQMNSALYNYETDEYVMLDGGDLHFDANNEHVVTDQSVYDLKGNKLTEWIYSSEVNFDINRKVTSSSKNRVLFQSSGVLENSSGISRVQMRDYDSGEVLAEIESQTKPVVTIAHKDSTLVAATQDNVVMFELATLEPIKQKAKLLDIKRLVIENNILALQTGNAFIAFRYNSDGTTSKPLVLNQKYSDFSIVGEHILVSKGNEVIRVDVDSGEQTIAYSALAEVRKIAILDEAGEKIVAILEDGSVWLPHIGEGSASKSYGVSADTLILTDNKSENFYLTSLLDGEGQWNPNIPRIRKFDSNGDGLQDFEAVWDSVTAIELAGKNRLWGATTTGDIILWDTLSGRRLQRIQAHKDQINDLHVIDSETIVSAANDGTINLWRTDIPLFDFKHAGFVDANLLGLFDVDLNKRHPEKLATIILDEKDGYIVTGSDGYYTASPGALNRASFIDGDEVLDYSQFDIWFNRPDIIAQRLDYSSPEQINLFSQLVEFRKSRYPRLPESIPLFSSAPELTVQYPDSLVFEKNIELPWSAKSSNRKLSKLFVEINGVPLFGVSGKTIRGEHDNGKINITLSSGSNHIKAFVSDTDGLISSASNLIVNRQGVTGKPDLYLLAIGVSDYSNDLLDLRYADKDARDIKSFYEHSSTSFSEIHYRTILNSNATRDNILSAKEFLQKAKEDDRVIIFFAGHGFLDKKDRYYFGTSDIDPSKPEINGLSYPELNSLVDGLSSRYKLLMLDTCHSGEVAPVKSTKITKLSSGVSARGFALNLEDAKPAFKFSLEALQGRFADLREATGTVVLSASGGKEYAQEKGDLANGVFTYSILKALKDNKADENGDSTITTAELRQFVYGEVLRLTNGEQKPTAREVNMNVEFAVN